MYDHVHVYVGIGAVPNVHVVVVGAVLIIIIIVVVVILVGVVDDVGYYISRHHGSSEVSPDRGSSAPSTSCPGARALTNQSLWILVILKTLVLILFLYSICKYCTCGKYS